MMRVIASSPIDSPDGGTLTVGDGDPLTSRGFDDLCDADLLQAWHADQQRDAFATLVDRYSRLVLSVCRRRCRTDADAEDAFQTTFLYLARNSHKIRHPERLVGWLHRVAQRAAVATLPSHERESSPMVEPTAATDDPLDRLTQKHEAIVLDEELAELPEHYRSAIVMHLYEGESIQSLADRLETTPGSVRGRLQRGKQLLANRLRRRGVVPVLAYAAAQSWTVESATASEATAKLMDRIDSDVNLPDPPIETSLLESLLPQGIRLMPSLSTITGIACGTALVALLMMSDGSGQDAGGRQVTLPGQQSSKASDAEITFSPQFGQTATGLSGGGGNAVASGGGGSAVAATPQADLGGAALGGAVQWSTRIVVPESKTLTAEKARIALSKEMDLTIDGTLSELPKVLSAATGVPVLLDKRGIAFATVEPTLKLETTSVSQTPLHSAIRMALEPHGLKVVVEDEGIVITADPNVLVHRGIGTTRWININQDAEARIAAALDSETTLEFIELPLSEAIEFLSEQNGIPVTIDRTALEEVGYSDDQPVTVSAKQITLRSALTQMLDRHELTYVVRGESLVVTSPEAAESRLATRMYWLEGTGFAAGDFQSIMDLVQTSVTPDTWEALGGPSTMAPVTTSRPGILISTTYRIHEVIDEFFSALRETHFGVDPITETYPSPAPSPSGGFGGGGMNGGGGFGGGGMF